MIIGLSMDPTDEHIIISPLVSDNKTYKDTHSLYVNPLLIT
jgi:hypothetical protein